MVISIMAKKNKMGRPKKMEDAVMVHAFVPGTLKSDLDEVAEREEKDQSAIIRTAINRYVQNSKRRSGNAVTG